MSSPQPCYFSGYWPVFEAEQLYQNARNEYQRAVTANPDGFIALMNLAYLELNTGRFDSAEDAIGQARERATRIAPEVLPRIGELDGYLKKAREVKIK